MHTLNIKLLHLYALNIKLLHFKDQAVLLRGEYQGYHSQRIIRMIAKQSYRAYITTIDLPGTPYSSPFLAFLLFFRPFPRGVARLTDAFMVFAWPNRSHGTRVVIPNESLTTALPRIKPFSLRSLRFAVTRSIRRHVVGRLFAAQEKILACSRDHLERVQPWKPPPDGPTRLPRSLLTVRR